MSGLRFSSFGAATMPLSKIVIDKELDMGRYSIKAQYRPEEWATEEVGWGDGSASTVLPPTEKAWTSYVPTVDMYTADISGYYTLTIERNPGSYYLVGAEIQVNGDTVVTLGVVPWSYTVMLNAGDVLSVYSTSYSGGGSSARCICTVDFTGKVGGAKTFDLTGKWLALGIDMKGLDATIKIHSVEIPYSEYVKCFPLVPSELSFPGGWEPTQERPVIKYYV